MPHPLKIVPKPVSSYINRMYPKKKGYSCTYFKYWDSLQHRNIIYVCLVKPKAKTRLRIEGILEWYMKQTTQ